MNHSGIQTGWYLEKYLVVLMVIHWGFQKENKRDYQMVIHLVCQIKNHLVNHMDNHRMKRMVIHVVIGMAKLLVNLMVRHLVIH